MKKLMMMVAVAGACVAMADSQILDIRPEPAKPGDAPSAVDWQNANNAALKKLDDAWCAEFFKGGRAAIDKELAWVMPAFGTQPLKATEIAVLTQYVMKLEPDVCGAGSWWQFWASCDCSENRRLWVAALLEHAAQAKEPEVTNWFLDQVRWCGCACAADKVRAIAEGRDEKVSAFAEMVARELEGRAIGK